MLFNESQKSHPLHTHTTIPSRTEEEGKDHLQYYRRFTFSVKNAFQALLWKAELVACADERKGEAAEHT